MMEKFGPLRNIWCMNFGRKHEYFKKLISNTHNFKNVTGTLTERHQLKLAYELSSDQIFPAESEPLSSVKNIRFGSLPQTLRVTIQENIGAPLSDDHIIPAIKSPLVDGIKYNVNLSSCLVLYFIKELPVFVQPKHILQL